MDESGVPEKGLLALRQMTLCNTLLFLATKPLLLVDQFSNGSDLPDLTTIQK